MSKYIIKNCPALYGIDDGFLCSGKSDDEIEKYCYSTPGCLLKRIVEKCKEELGIRYNDLDQGRNELANEILQLMDIEEVKNGQFKI